MSDPAGTTVRTLGSAGSRRRSLLLWGSLALVLLLGGALVALIQSSVSGGVRGELEPTSTAPEGSGALVRVLEEQGVGVTVVRNTQDRDAAIAEAGPHTLVVDSTAPLSDQLLEEATAESDAVVLVTPSARDVRVFFPGSESAGQGNTLVSPTCESAVADRSGDIAPGRLFTAGDATVACYPSGDGFGLLSASSAERTVSALDARDLWSNERITENGNAALALGLLGAQPEVIWYLPSPADGDFAGPPPTIGELTPPWVTPAILTLIAAAIAAAIWRARRFGPLVAENLPITVRAQETTEGRARLYADSGDLTHALDQLRISALSRLGRRLGLGPGTSATAIADAVALRLGGDRAAIRAILIDAEPTDHRELVELADRTRELEDQLGRSVRPEGNTQ